MKIKFSSNKKDISSILNRLNTTVLVISLSILTIASLLFVYFSTVTLMTKTLREEAKTGAKRIEWVIKSYKNIAQGIGSIPELSNPRISPSVKELILANKTNEYKFIRCKTIKADGYSEMDSHYRGDREYFREALKGNVCISDPLIAKTDGNVSLVIAAPVWKSGIYNGRIDSVLFCSLGTEILNSILGEFDISRNSNVYIIGKEGKTVASIESDKVNEGYSNIKLAITSKKLKKIADFEEKALAGSENAGQIFIGANLHAYSSCQIEGTPGWALIIDAPVVDFLTTFWIALVFTITISIIIIMISRQLIRKHSMLISEPVKHMAERLRQAAVGDFKTDVNLEDSIEEIKIIANATHSLVNRMDTVLNGISSDFAASNLMTFINFDDYNSIIERFEKAMKVHLCIIDSKMNKLVGSFNEKSIKSFSSNILTNKKAVGKYVISPAEECTLSDENLQFITDSLANLIGRIIENVISREIHYKALQQNNLINNEKMLQSSENMAKDILDWTQKLKRLDFSSGNASFKRTYEELEKEAISFNTSVHENAEYSRFTNFNPDMDENDYSLSYLLENIEIRTARSAIKKDNITVTSTERPEETLFGDREAIEKIVTRIILYLEIKNPDCSISAISSLVKHNFGYNLQFKFIVESHKFTEKDFEVLSTLEKPGKKSDTGLLSEEIKLRSAYNHIWHMNGTVNTLSQDNRDYKLMIEIPQL